jgi:PKD repeat protein
MRVRGDVGKNALGENKATVRLGWGDVRCEETDCGTTFLRSEEAFKTPDGPGKYLDDLRAYKVRPKLANFDAVTGDVPLGAANADLVTRSVHNPSWTFYIDMALPANAGLKLDNMDEIELVITHEAYTLQAGYCAGPGASSPAPYRAYRPMENVLDPQSSPLLQAMANDRRGIAAAEANDLNGFYAGTVVPSSPEYMPAIDLNLMLTAAAGGSTAAALSGYVDVTHGLHFPAVDETTGHGPALSGSWSGDGFSLHSDKPFTITLSSGLTVTRTLLLSSGVISNSGEILTGVYLETLTGLTPEPMEITGEFQLWRLPLALAPTANFGAFPASGPPPLTVTFNDLSSNEPTAWAWDFGDGGASTEQHPTHVYSQPGMYDVTLTATNAIGADTLTMPDLITVSEPAAPVAHFTASPRSGSAPLTVTFEDQSAGGPTSWGWDFGDGGASTVQHPQHTYNQPGSYTVTLTAGNAIGLDSLAVPGYITVVEAKKIYLPLVLRSAP